MQQLSSKFDSQLDIGPVPLHYVGIISLSDIVHSKWGFAFIFWVGNIFFNRNTSIYFLIFVYKIDFGLIFSFLKLCINFSLATIFLLKKIHLC